MQLPRRNAAPRHAQIHDISADRLTSCTSEQLAYQRPIEARRHALLTCSLLLLRRDVELEVANLHRSTARLRKHANSFLVVGERVSLGLQCHRWLFRHITFPMLECVQSKQVVRSRGNEQYTCTVDIAAQGRLTSPSAMT